VLNVTKGMLLFINKKFNYGKSLGTYAAVVPYFIMIIEQLSKCVCVCVCVRHFIQCIAIYFISYSVSYHFHLNSIEINNILKTRAHTLI